MEQVSSLRRHCGDVLLTTSTLFLWEASSRIDITEQKKLASLKPPSGKSNI